MKLRYIILTLFILLLAGLTANAESPLRVGLYYGSTALETVNVSSFEGLETSAAEDLGGYFMATVANGDIVLKNADGAEIYTVPWGGEVRAVARDGCVVIEGKKYRGNVIFIPRDGKITVINELYTDDYVKGVIAKEMPSSWPLEALKAQAVAARCFAYSSIGKHSDYGFDVCSTTNCQVYGGMDAETPSTIRAVEESEGMVVCYNGKIISTLFYSSNGGYMEAAQNVWSGSYPYFKTMKDEFERTEDISGAVWTVEFTPEQIRDKLAASNIFIGDITGMEITKTSESGRVLEVVVYGSVGKKSFTKNSARTFLGLKSQLYTITPPPTGRVYCIGAGGQATLEGIYFVITEKGVERRGAGMLAPREGKYVISGRGYGHGVGMSQWGAYHMSQKGYDYKDILTYYYRGTQVVNYAEIR